MKQSLEFDTSHLYPVGTSFTYTRGSYKNGHAAEVIGYRVEFNTDTDRVHVSYRIQYQFLGQVIKTNVPVTTVSRALGAPFVSDGAQ